MWGSYKFAFVFIADSPLEGINQAEQFFDTVSKSLILKQILLVRINGYYN